MIVIEEQAEIKLMRRLEQLRTDPQSIDGIDLDFSQIPANERPTAESLGGILRSVFTEHSATAQLYCMEDGQVVVVIEAVLPKQLRQLAALLPMGTERYLSFYEFHYQINKLVVKLQQKLDAAQARAEAEKARIQNEQRARKREQILAYTPDAMDRTRLTSARENRNTHELMIVEDDAFSRRLLENILPRHLHITSLGEPEQVLERYTLLVPDLLFLDINLPDVSGHELLDKILAIDPNAYIIMISGNSDRENVIRAMSHGARGFIAKPFARERVQEYLDRCPTIIKELPHAHS